MKKQKKLSYKELEKIGNIVGYKCYTRMLIGNEHVNDELVNDYIRFDLKTAKNIKNDFVGDVLISIESMNAIKKIVDDVNPNNMIFITNKFWDINLNIILLKKDFETIINEKKEKNKKKD